MHLPIRRLVPHEASANIQLAILVEVGDAHPFAAELGVELRLFEANLLGVLAGGQRSNEEREQADDPTAGHGIGNLGGKTWEKGHCNEFARRSGMYPGTRVGEEPAEALLGRTLTPFARLDPFYVPPLSYWV